MLVAVTYVVAASHDSDGILRFRVATLRSTYAIHYTACRRGSCLLWQWPPSFFTRCVHRLLVHSSTSVDAQRHKDRTEAATSRQGATSQAPAFLTSIFRGTATTVCGRVRTHLSTSKPLSRSCAVPVGDLPAKSSCFFLSVLAGCSDLLLHTMGCAVRAR